MSETQVMTLTDFLLARIAEDEASAKSVHDYDCAQLDTFQFYGPDETEADYGCGRPSRILAECAAKRRIVERWRAPSVGEYYGDGYAAATDEALRDLASAYADHPDFRDEWRA